MKLFRKININKKKSARYHLKRVKSIGKNFRCEENFEIFNGHKYITIGDNVSLVDALLNASKEGFIKIENDVFCGHGVKIISRAHDILKIGIERQAFVKDEPIIIKQGAWLAS